jgi:plasmid maintenance system antidote protein VapI
MAEMSLRLSDALGTSPTLWIDLQTQYVLWRQPQTQTEDQAL